MIKINRKHKAFSMIEIMITLVVLALGLMPILFFITSTTRGVSSTIEELFATNYANEIIDGINSFSYDEVPLTEEKNINVLIAEQSFFNKLHLKPPRPGFERLVRIYEKKPDNNLQMYDENTRKELEKLLTFKVIETTVKYKVKDEKAGTRDKLLKVYSIIGGDSCDI